MMESFLFAELSKYGLSVVIIVIVLFNTLRINIIIRETRDLRNNFIDHLSADCNRCKNKPE